MEDGYVVLALGDSRYVDLAINLALSIRRSDTRPISIVTDPRRELPPATRPLFDRVIEAAPDEALRGAMNKARLYELTPYRRTMYVDADCLLFTPRIAFFWQRYRGRAFAVEGHRQSEGPAFACSLGVKDAAVLCAEAKIPYLSVFNAGVMYFEQSETARAVFDRVKALHAGARDRISYRYKHDGEYADEPFFAVALAAEGIPPLEPPLTQRLQVTTPNLVDGVFDLDTGDLRLVKHPPGGTAQIWAGVLCHFCGLAPMAAYFDLADRLRRDAGLPAMDRSLFRPVVLTPTVHEERQS
jgi:hypothetical protein